MFANDANSGRERLEGVNGLSHAKAMKKFEGFVDPDTGLKITPRTIAKARQGRVPALERLGRAKFVEGKKS